MIKICHMTSSHNSNDTRIFEKECTSLAKYGYEVFLVSHGETFNKNNVHIVGVGARPDSRKKRMIEGAKKVYKTALKLDCDIYHFHDPELLPYGLKLKKKGKKVIFDSHEHTAEAILEKKWIPLFARKLAHLFFSKYQAFVCQRLDAVVSVTPNVVEYFKLINPRTFQITNFPIFEESITWPSYESRTIGFAGGVSEQWNHHSLLNSIYDLENVSYYLCGAAEDKYLNLLKEMDGWNKVKYFGKIPFEKVPDIFSQCSVGVALLQPGNNTDWYNGTIGNTKIFEEMMAGLPIVCTDFLLWKEFVEKYQCGICVKSDNIEQISSAITKIINNPSLAKQMGENGRRAVKEMYNWSVEEEKLIELYRAVS